jgi:hypothetical protein
VTSLIRVQGEFKRSFERREEGGGEGIGRREPDIALPSILI